MRKTIFGLLLTVLVAMVAVSGTALASDHATHRGGKAKLVKHSSHKAKHASHKAKGKGKHDGDGNYGDHADNDDNHYGDDNDNDGGDGGYGGNGGNGDHKKHHAPAYGVAVVNVSRGHVGAKQNDPTIWARYSTRLGSPVGDTAGGVFRFTCSTVAEPCVVSLGATVISDKTVTGVSVYPRILIHRQDYDAGGPEVYCEYGDGLTDGASQPITSQPFTTAMAFADPATYTLVPFDIGLTPDCPDPAETSGGLKTSYTVNAGYYDVQTSFVFNS